MNIIQLIKNICKPNPLMGHHPKILQLTKNGTICPICKNNLYLFYDTSPRLSIKYDVPYTDFKCRTCNFFAWYDSIYYDKIEIHFDDNTNTIHVYNLSFKHPKLLEITQDEFIDYNNPAALKNKLNTILSFT